MKTISGISLILVIFMAQGTSSVNAQKTPSQYIILTNQDTVFGKIRLKAPLKKDAFVKVKCEEKWVIYPVSEISGYRIQKSDYIMKPGLHSVSKVPSHYVIADGEVSLFGQYCSSCGAFINVHVEFDDEEIVCVNKENYMTIILPRLVESEKFRVAWKDRSVKYSFFQNIMVRKLTMMVQVYNEVEQD